MRKHILTVAAVVVGVAVVGVSVVSVSAAAIGSAPTRETLKKWTSDVFHSGNAWTPPQCHCGRTKYEHPLCGINVVICPDCDKSLITQLP